VTTLFRLFVIGQLGLGDDEGHYFAFSRHPQLSYFDHPPLIGLIIRASTTIFGINEFAVRLPTVLLFVLTCYLLFLLARDMFNDRVAFFAVLLMNVTPVFSFLGSVLTVPDAPLAFFWAAFMFCFWKVLTPVTFKMDNPDGKFHYSKIWVKKERSWYWYLMGLLLGLGLLSKYNMILLVPSIAVFLYFSKRHRSWFSRPEPYIGLFISFLVFLPVILWNLQNGWASFGFQLSHGFGKAAPKFSIALLLKCLGAQAGYISPLLFFIYWFSVFFFAYKAFREKDRRALFIFSFSFPTLFLFNSIASFNEILPHWPATGYMVLTIAVADIAVNVWHKKWFMGLTIAAWALGAMLTVLVPLQALYKVLPPELFLPKSEAFKVEDGVTKAEKVDVTNELYGWDAVGRRVAELKGFANDDPFIFTQRHYLSSQLTFYVPGHPRIYCLSERIDAYDFWQRDLSGLNGRDGIFVCDNRFYMDPTKVYPFKSWEPIKPVEIFRAGRKIRVFYLWYGRSFDLKALPKEYTAASLPPLVPLKEAIVNFDHQVFWAINRDVRCRVLDVVMWSFTFIGYGAPLAVIVGLLLWFTRRETFWNDFFTGIVVVFLGSMLVHALKDRVARVRPLTLWGDSVHVLGQKLYRCSFPSGHAQSSFGAATYLSFLFPRFWWLLFLLAFMVGFSRIYVGAHFPIDVASGAFIGVVFTYLVTLLARFLINKKQSNHK
jgi:membrane-associated phospholipid phosphatase